VIWVLEQAREANRYDDLLGFGKRVEERIRLSRKVLTVEDQQRISTRHTTATQLVNRDNGFFNTIIETFIGEIPSGEKTGMHRHMNEACIYILEGKGHSVIEDQRYDWKKGDAMHIPFFAWHQHFNDGKDAAKYLAAIPTELMRSLGIWKMEQREDKGKI
jgi:gentisate 1,2-dioxygenase